MKIFLSMFLVLLFISSSYSQQKIKTMTAIFCEQEHGNHTGGITFIVNHKPFDLDITFDSSNKRLNAKIIGFNIDQMAIGELYEVRYQPRRSGGDITWIKFIRKTSDVNDCYRYENPTNKSLF